MRNDQLVVISVLVDLGAHEIVVNGVNLTRTNRPTMVVLAGSPLSVVSAHPTEIVVTLPIDIQPGDYLLTVSTGDTESRTDFWDLTIASARDISGVTAGAVTASSDWAKQRTSSW